MLAIQTLNLTLLCLLVQLIGLLLLVSANIICKGLDPGIGLATRIREGICGILLGRRLYEFYGTLVVWSPTSWTQTIHGRLDIVVAELADLQISSVQHIYKFSRPVERTWYPQGQGLKYLSLTSKSSTQRGLSRVLDDVLHGSKGSKMS